MEQSFTNLSMIGNGLLAALEASVIVAVTDASGRIIDVNRAFCDISGFSREELIGETHRVVNSGHHPREFWAQMWRVVARGGVWRAEVCNRSKAGRLYWVDTTIAPVLGPDRKVQGYLSVRVDITARKQATDLAAQSESKFRALFESSPVGITLREHKTHRLLQVNEVMCEMLGRPEPAAASTTLQDFAPGFGADVAAAEADRLREHGVFGPRHLELTGAHGRVVPVVMHSSLVVGPSGERLIWSLFQDITEQRRFERELAAARDLAQAANRAKDEFLSNMSHEIRTPMTAILGYAEMLRDEPSMNEATRSELVGTIERAGRHLLCVINDILDLSKIEAGKMTLDRLRVDLPSLLDDAVSLLRPAAQAKGLALHYQAGAPLPLWVAVDPTRLRQVLLNVIGNAIKFTTQGAVTVIARVEGAAEHQRLIVDVADTGIGLSEEQAGVLFRPFTQADTAVTRQFGGTGLGLTVSRKLARLAGGDVSLLMSTPGAGSTFRVEYPLGAADPAHETPAAPPAQPGGRSLEGAWLLLAEDGPDNQRLIRHHLSKAGARVDVAANGRIALAMIDANERAGERYDLLVTDMQMPEMDGYSLVRTLRRREAAAGVSPAAQLPVVALTAHAMADDREKCFAAGCDAYATKPIDRARLLAICTQWVRTRHLSVNPSV